jgi:archaeosortase A (PGF-CTERM-specific)
VSVVSDALAWTVVLGFAAAGGIAATGHRRRARYVAAGTWAAFAVFWLAVFPVFAFEMRSFVEGGLSLAAVPLCLHAGYLVARGRDSLLVLSSAVAVMGLVYLPVETVPVVRRVLVETVAAQTDAGIRALGYDPTFTTGPEFGYQNRFVFEDETGHEYSTYIVTACTGIGSMAIFGGLIAAVRAPVYRRVITVATAAGIIWVLNVVRNVFIAVAFGDQWFQQDVLVRLVTPAIYDDPHLTSYFVADRVISQVLSVVALVGITLVVVRQVPELLSILDEAVYVCTRRELDLGAALGITTNDGAEDGTRDNLDGAVHDGVDRTSSTARTGTGTKTKPETGTGTGPDSDDD